MLHAHHNTTHWLHRQRRWSSNVLRARRGEPLRTTATDSAADGLARRILADPRLEGQPLKFLDVSEKYWKVCGSPPRLAPLPRLQAAAAGTLQRRPCAYLGPQPPPTLTPCPLQALRQSEHEPDRPRPSCVASSPRPLAARPEYDAVVCGGTLGMFLATALQLKGHRVCVVERRVAQGRLQEWNSSRAELQVRRRPAPGQAQPGPAQCRGRGSPGRGGRQGTTCWRRRPLG
jgi:hypothetical protein